MDVTPTLPVVDMSHSLAFYEAAGFDVRSMAVVGLHSCATTMRASSTWSSNLT
jgi:predicted lactoylglutathione lyase